MQSWGAVHEATPPPSDRDLRLFATRTRAASRPGAIRCGLLVLFALCIHGNCGSESDPARRLADTLPLAPLRVGLKNSTLLTSSDRSSSTSLRRVACVPSFWIVGARKGGTTSLITYLDQHPRIRAANMRGLPQDGEVGGWQLFVTNPRAFLPAYNAKFPKLAAGEVTGDSAVGHGSSCYAPRQLRASCGVDRLRILFLLRDPIERVISNALMRLRMDPVLGRRTSPEILIERELAEALAVFEDLGDALWDPSEPAPCFPISAIEDRPNLIFESLYGVHLSRWLAQVPASQVFVAFSEEFNQHRADLVREACAFIQVSPAGVDWETVTSARYNERPASQASPTLEAGLVKRLRAVFARDIARLRTMLEEPGRLSGAVWRTTLGG